VPRPLLQVTNLRKYYPIARTPLSPAAGQVYAVDGVSFAVERGETLGLVGESGCGKTTVGRTVLKLIDPTSGEIVFDGQNITRLGARQMRPYRRQMQIVFQDPYSSLDPRMTAGAIVAEPLVVHGIGRARERDEQVAALFSKVGLRPEQRYDYPHSFSGGQRQRIGIARALALNPRLVVCDEPVSALDVSVQAQVVNLMMDLQDEMGLSYLIIAHDLAVISRISHRIGVMYLGRIVEMGPSTDVVCDPLHPYTVGLLSAAPVPDPAVKPMSGRDIEGEIPSPSHPPAGCHFHTRCPHVMPHCRTLSPPLREVASGRLVACHLHDKTVENS
jgi:peptide/nickel transport system ATP-binding protein/oligopeptide transport system ATP-binding protein